MARSACFSPLPFDRRQPVPRVRQALPLVAALGFTLDSGATALHVFAEAGEGVASAEDRSGSGEQRRRQDRLYDSALHDQLLIQVKARGMAPRRPLNMVRRRSRYGLAIRSAPIFFGNTTDLAGLFDPAAMA
jgi:hypothetical protein